MNADRPSTETPAMPPEAGQATSVCALPSETEATLAVSAKETPVLVDLSFSAPVRWLIAGAKDGFRHPGIAAFYGLSFWLMAFILSKVFEHQPEYTMTAISGCLLVGPFLAIGLYDVSRRIERGEPVELGTSLTCWDEHLGSMSMLVLVLIVLELLWGRASLVVFAVAFENPNPGSGGLFSALLSPENYAFIAVYLCVGGLFAALVFSTSVVSIPMILDRDTDAVTAALSSIGVVLKNMGVLAWWGFLISCMVLASLLMPWAAGIAVVGPLLGHATWHAYRAAISWPAVSQAPLTVQTASGP